MECIMRIEHAINLSIGMIIAKAESGNILSIGEHFILETALAKAEYKKNDTSNERENLKLLMAQFINNLYNYGIECEPIL